MYYRKSIKRKKDSKERTEAKQTLKYEQIYLYA